MRLGQWWSRGAVGGIGRWLPDRTSPPPTRWPPPQRLRCLGQRGTYHNQLIHQMFIPVMQVTLRFQLSYLSIDITENQIAPLPTTGLTSEQHAIQQHAAMHVCGLHGAPRGSRRSHATPAAPPGHGYAGALPLRNTSVGTPTLESMSVI